jgi:hypothetical protein
VEDDNCKELKEVVLRGMACLADLIIMSVRCVTATSVSSVEQVPSKHCVFR